MTETSRININDVLEDLHIQVPKALMYEDKYKPNKATKEKGLSNDAKILYGVLMDRTSLSIYTYKATGDRNFIDEEGNIFIYFDNSSIEEILNVSVPKAVTVKKELVKFGLLEEVRQGLGKSNRLYVNKPKVDSNNLKQYVDIFKVAVDNKKSAEKERIEKYRNEQAETIANTLYLKNLSTSTKKNEVQVLNNFMSSNTKDSNTEVNDLEDFKSVVVLSNSEHEQKNFLYEIQKQENKSVFEKVNEIDNIISMSFEVKALVHKFIEFNILVSEAQIKMLNEVVYDVAIKALDTTVAQSGKTFSYFWNVYKSKEEEDINSLAGEFVFKPSFSL